MGIIEITKCAQENWSTFSTNSYAFQKFFVIVRLINLVRVCVRAFSNPIIYALADLLNLSGLGVNDEQN